MALATFVFVRLQAIQAGGGKYKFMKGLSYSKDFGSLLYDRKNNRFRLRSRVRKGMPDRKGFPHPCGSAAPSLARTLCSSGIPFLPDWADASL
jgi:hypothetical protein